MPEDREPTIVDRVGSFLPTWRKKPEESAEKRSGKHVAPENAQLDPVPQISQQTPSQETVYLKEIASVLSIPVSDKDTPGDIAFKIRQRLENTERYRGSVLSDESFAKAKSAIRIPADAETFAEYHAFIKKVVVKRIIVLGDNEQR